jgi:hypothetical protein
MPKRSFKTFINFHLPRFTQISESHCGPAVVQMLLSNLGIDVSQEAVAEAGGATQLIELNGMRVDQLALAVHRLAPQVQFWSKDHSTLEELIEIVKRYHYPVGVEWQGVFEDPDEENDDTDKGESEEEDYGHFSVVTHIRPKKKQLIIADPYKDFISQDRIFSFSEFEQRWWDFNEVEDPETGRKRLVEDYHMLFVIIPPGETFPLRLQMQSHF